MNEKAPEAEEKGPAPLSYEQFTTIYSGYPAFNNFYAYFDSSQWGGIYREKDCFKKFQQDHPELCAEVLAKVSSRKKQDERGVALSTLESLKPFFPDLYRAFLAMRKYVESEEELFS